MPGTRAGGLKAAATVKKRFGNDHYQKIGSNGGKKSRGGGFEADNTMASLAGKLGGLKSRRGGKDKDIDWDEVRRIEKLIKEYKKKG